MGVPDVYAGELPFAFIVLRGEAVHKARECPEEVRMVILKVRSLILDIRECVDGCVLCECSTLKRIKHRINGLMAGSSLSVLMISRGTLLGSC